MRQLSWYERIYWRLRLAWMAWRDRHVDHVSMREEQARSFYQWSRQATPDFSEEDWQEAQRLVQQDLTEARRKRVQALARLPVMYDDTWEGSY